MSESGTIRLNGLPHPAATPLTVADLLASLGLDGKPVVVELNELPVFPRDYPGTRIHDGDRVEIVTLAAGG